MAPTFEKLNLKNVRKIVVLNAPASFEPELAGLRGVEIARDLKGAGPLEFSLAFVVRQSELDRFSKDLAKKVFDDAVVWFAYPKKTSKKYTCEFNRDTGWVELGKANFEPVRMVAIDEDWSAIRFRRTDFIKSLTRSKEHAISPKGRAKASGKA